MNINIGNNIEKINIQNQKFYRKIIVFFIFSLCVICLTILIGITSKSVYVKQGFQTIFFKKEKSSILSYNTIITYFFKNSDQAIVKSLDAVVKSDNLNILKKCIIQTPNIRQKIYYGNTEIIEIDSNNDSFVIPQYMKLENHNNAQNNYIITNELHGDFDKYIESSLPFKLNDDDLFLSGDNLYILTKINYLKITKNSHLIYTKTDIEEKNKPNIYDITSQKMEVFGNNNYAILENDVKIINEDKTAKSQYAKIYFNQNQKPTDIFMEKNVDIQQNDNNAISDFGFFDIENNIIVLYKNVFISSNTNKSNGEFYIYKTDDKSSFTFNKYTILPKQEQNKVYNILNKLANEVDVFNKMYIQNVIKENRANINSKISKSSDNYGIDRTKRTKVNIIN